MECEITRHEILLGTICAKGMVFYFTTAMQTRLQLLKEAYPDHTQFDPENKHFDPSAIQKEPRWFMVDIKLKGKFKNPVTLKAIKENPKLKDFRLIKRGNRLSVFPVNKKEWDEILKMGK